MTREDMTYVLSNTNFMNWVMNKLKEHYYIDDKKSNLNEQDIFYAKKLSTLYELIADYATKNGIESKIINQNNMYFVYYNGEIIFVYKNANSYGCICNTIDKKNLPFCINLDDVRRFKIKEILSDDNDMFSHLKKDIIKLCNKGVSPEFIIEIMYKVLDEENINKQNHVYKKI